jgi:hypothetical protein
LEVILGLAVPSMLLNVSCLVANTSYDEDFHALLTHIKTKRLPKKSFIVLMLGPPEWV